MYSKFLLRNDPNQTIALNISGDKKNISLQAEISYNSMAEYWTISLYDPKTENPIVAGIPLLCGHDLLEQFRYKGIGSVVLASNSKNSYTSPDSTNLNQYCLIWEL